MKRQIIKIDEERCNGCGLCIPNCHEGALQIIDGKCRLISDLFCDGLGACIGHCPEDALAIEEREAEEYDEVKVLQIMMKQSMNVVAVHLEHLKEHNAMEYYNQAIEYLQANNIEIPKVPEKEVSNGGCPSGGCPGSAMHTFERKVKEITGENSSMESALEQWPIQLHLVNPNAPYFKGKEISILSTCSGFATPMVHPDFIADRAVVVACPKLDYTEPYTPKLTSIFQTANTQKVIIVRMEVPCCGGLTKIACDAAEASGVKGIVVEEHTLSITGAFVRKSIVFQN